jgi:hypothetical protein
MCLGVRFTKYVFGLGQLVLMVTFCELRVLFLSRVGLQLQEDQQNDDCPDKQLLVYTYSLYTFTNIAQVHGRLIW